MNLFSYFRGEIEAEIEAWAEHGDLSSHLRSEAFTVEPPKDPAHGDVATNAALILARPLRRKPRDIADRLVAGLAARPGVARAEVAGPGFVNIRLTDAFWRDRLADVLRLDAGYGRADLGAGQRVNIEYVSANPTGPLHVGHARGAVLGDVLANLLAFVGYAVTREYYINDAGAQVDLLARSVHHRYLEALGREVGPLPESYYPGDYVIPIARALADEDGDRWAAESEAGWLPHFRLRAIDAMMAMIRADLSAIGIRHDVFSSERALVEAGAVDRAIAHLDAEGLLYTGTLDAPKGKPDDDWEPRPQLLFRSTAYGDDTDRPLRKSDGSWTYFASDIAYHFDKVQRGFRSLVDVLGADHGGYVRRMEAAVAAMSGGEGRLDVMLCQMVRLFDAGEPVKMSKRSGTFVSLRELIDRVGGDAVRFMLSIRRHDQALDFDLAKVTEQSRDNPIFYVQYAHARVRSVVRHAAESLPGIDLAPDRLAETDLARLEHAGEVAVIRLLAQWPRTVELAARSREPHRIAYYLQDLAAAFHALWNQGREDASLRFLASDDRAVTTARLALVSAVGIVLANGLRLFGIEPVEELRSDEPL